MVSGNSYLILAAWALGSSNEGTREWRAKARYTSWESPARRRWAGKTGCWRSLALAASGFLIASESWRANLAPSGEGDLPQIFATTSVQPWENKTTTPVIGVVVLFTHVTLRW